MKLRDLLEKIYRGMDTGMLTLESEVKVTYDHPDLHEINSEVQDPQVDIDLDRVIIGDLDWNR